MQLETLTYARNPLIARAVQVTADNLPDVASWCEGRVEEWPNETYIKIDNVNRPYSQRQTQAHVGDFVVQLITGKGFKVYPPRAFHKSFTLVEEGATVEHTSYRDASSGEYVTEEYAEANPDTTVSETTKEEIEVNEATKRANERGPIKASSKPSPIHFATANKDES